MSDGMILDRSELDDLLDKYVVLLLNIARIAPLVSDGEIITFEMALQTHTPAYSAGIKNMMEVESYLKANGINSEVLHTIRNAILANYKSLFRYKSPLDED